jgi:hypothetical protein
MEATKELSKHIEAAKAEAIGLAKSLAGALTELKKYGLHVHVTNDKEFKALAVSFGIAGEAPAPAKGTRGGKAPKAAKGKRGKRGGQSEAVVAALTAKPLTTGELKEAIKYTGANLSAVLASVAKAGKIAKNGKLWHVKK